MQDYGLFEFSLYRLSLVAQQQTICLQCRRHDMQVQSLGWEDAPEEETATHSSNLGQKITMDRRAWRATVHGVTKELDTTE